LEGARGAKAAHCCSRKPGVAAGHTMKVVRVLGIALAYFICFFTTVDAVRRVGEFSALAAWVTDDSSVLI
jgi:uncharacterized membrane protein